MKTPKPGMLAQIHRNRRAANYREPGLQSFIVESELEMYVEPQITGESSSLLPTSGEPDSCALSN
ncbi:hypothetical protein, partial [Pseudomonas protegens]|uniref:hypothetical protein n=1 Tax=Pseudomonas protegens TaxID=380021 RepID=UPI001B327886